MYGVSVFIYMCCVNVVFGRIRIVLVPRRKMYLLVIVLVVRGLRYVEC